MTEKVIDSIPGAANLVEWFGEWPSFHDAEILKVILDRSARSSIQIHTWRMTSEVDQKRRYVTDHHMVVTFWFERITDLDLGDFNSQNVISGLDVERTTSGIRVKF